MADAPQAIEAKRAEVAAKIADQIGKRERYGNLDFRRTNWTAWASLLASAIVTIWTAYGAADNGFRILLALFAAVPGLMVAIETSFNYSQRYRMNGKAVYDLTLIKSALDRGTDPWDVEKLYADYMKKFEDGFPGVVLPSLRPGKGQDGGDVSAA